MSNFPLHLVPSSVETPTATREGIVSHSIVWCDTIRFVTVWTILSSKCGDNNSHWSECSLTVKAALQLQASRYVLPFHHSNVIFSLGVPAQNPQSCVKSISTLNYLFAIDILFALPAPWCCHSMCVIFQFTFPTRVIPSERDRVCG